MKAHLIDTHLLVLRSRSNIRLMFLKRLVFRGISVLQTHFFFISSPEHGVITHRPSVHNFLVKTLNIYKYQPISTKLGQSVYDHKISDEFDYGTNRTKTVPNCLPLNRKFAIFDFVYTLAYVNIDQSVSNLATIYMPIRCLVSSIMGQIEPEHPELFALEFGKIAECVCLYSYNLQLLTNQHQTWSKCM